MAETIASERDLEVENLKLTIAKLIFLMCGIGQVIIPTVLSTNWTITLLVLDPVPLYSLMFLVLLSGLIVHNIFILIMYLTKQNGI